MSSSAMSINSKCLLRRNVRTQPYGRCSVCTLHLRGCHAFSSSVFSFLVILFVLGAMAVPPGLAQRGMLVGAVLFVLVQGLASHRRTDQLIYSEHQLRDHARNLEAAVTTATQEVRGANRELARTNLTLIERDRQRETFVGGLTHDLRTPLTAVTGAADNLLLGIAGPLTDDQREYVEIVREHGHRLNTTIGELLEAARAEAGNIALSITDVDVRELADEVRRGLEPLARERDLVLGIEGDARVHADRNKLRRVLENLVGNAVKYTSRGGKVAIALTPASDRVEITVRDDGPGISPQLLPRIFDRYVQGTEGQVGTGLGLSIARNLVRLHGGEVTVASAPDRGSEFLVVLPRDGTRRKLPLVEA
jgi:signal transduction histidine kinase